MNRTPLTKILTLLGLVAFFALAGGAPIWAGDT